MSKSKVLVVGGSGYIGLRVSKELLKYGYHVAIASRKPEKARPILGNSVDYIALDVERVQEHYLKNILSEYDYLVFSAGVDDRVVPKAPAYDFFCKMNVGPCNKVLKVAGESGIKKVVFMSSYFCHFNREWPEMELEKYHPYIRSRMRQEKEAQEILSQYPTKLVILELPYVLGQLPGEKHLLKPLVKYLYSSLPIFTTEGGTAIITVKNVAEAVVGSIKDRQIEGIFAISDMNLSWVELWKKINPKRKAIVLRKGLLKFLIIWLELYYWVLGKESGLKLKKFMDFHTKNLYLEIEEVRLKLGYTSDGIQEAFDEVVDNS